MKSGQPQRGRRSCWSGAKIGGQVREARIGRVPGCWDAQRPDDAAGAARAVAGSIPGAWASRPERRVPRGGQRSGTTASRNPAGRRDAQHPARPLDPSSSMAGSSYLRPNSTWRPLTDAPSVGTAPSVRLSSPEPERWCATRARGRRRGDAGTRPRSSVIENTSTMREQGQSRGLSRGEVDRCEADDCGRLQHRRAAGRTGLLVSL